MKLVTTPSPGLIITVSYEAHLSHVLLLQSRAAHNRAMLPDGQNIFFDCLIGLTGSFDSPDTKNHPRRWKTMVLYIVDTALKGKGF